MDATDEHTERESLAPNARTIPAKDEAAEAAQEEMEAEIAEEERARRVLRQRDML
jgi:hypothetical protein